MDVDVLTDLKKKVIGDYNIIYKKLRKGYKEDCSVILNEISFIEAYEYLDNKELIKEYFLNYEL